MTKPQKQRQKDLPKFQSLPELALQIEELKLALHFEKVKTMQIVAMVEALTKTESEVVLRSWKSQGEQREALSLLRSFVVELVKALATFPKAQ